MVNTRDNACTGEYGAENGARSFESFKTLFSLLMQRRMATTRQIDGEQAPNMRPTNAQ